jgi:hypothetical protein
MQAIRTVVTAAIVLATVTATSSFAADIARKPLEQRPVSLFTVVNATFDSVTSLAMAPADSGAFEEVRLGGSLPGGLASTTVHLPAGTCLRDMRVTFRNGSTKVFPAIDVCRTHALRLGTGASADER